MKVSRRQNSQEQLEGGGKKFLSVISEEMKSNSLVDLSNQDEKKEMSEMICTLWWNLPA